eukprot:TRINITY_DN18327_c0_g1_i1.p2 TRINITY_DN18327_c0_g1~~TRINITY_DN18327_c0_g1_i1.p2  ORF type:complete len:277 (+),score=58.65 TRINITY_DN18327_c0_g1_i1:46-876(+)
MASRDFPNGEESPEDDDGGIGLSRMSTSMSSSSRLGSSRGVLDSRLRRTPTATSQQMVNPAMASILSACQGMSEESLMVMADMINYVCKRQGGRATGKRRGANTQAEAPQTVDHVQEWTETQNELLGLNVFQSEFGAPPDARAAQRTMRRSSSCPPCGDSRDFQKGTRVTATKAIKSKKVVVVTQGMEGTVNYTAANGRVNVSFDRRCDGGDKAINVREEYLAPAALDATGASPPPRASSGITPPSSGGSMLAPPTFQSTGFGLSPPPSPVGRAGS